VQRWRDDLTWAGQGMRQIAERVPSTLFVFLAGIFVSNGVNLFNVVYGGDIRPRRATILLVSSVTSMAAAALWTVVAAKIDQFTKTVDSVPYGRPDRDAVCAAHWWDIRRRLTAYLVLATLVSFVAVWVLLVPV
jgi:hypothetical protein